MVSRVSSMRPSAWAGRAVPFGLGSAQLEVLKWTACAVMLYAHSLRYIGGGIDGWPYHLGRICFPLFALSVAIPLARDPVAKGERLAFGTVLFALVAQLLVQPLRDGAALNVLFLFVAAGAWLAAEGYSASERLLLRSLALVVGFLAEFSLPGLALIVCLVRAVRHGSAVWGVVAALALCCVGVLEASAGVLLAPLYAALVGVVGLGVPRWPGLFPRVYVWQFVGFWIWRVL